MVRNLSHLRVRDPMSERAAEFERGAPSLREPDQGILDHERKRKIELRCLELQLELEEKESVILLCHSALNASILITHFLTQDT